MNEKLKVYQSIAAVTSIMAKHGIAKDKVNEMQRYKFRGIDDVLNALSSLLAEHKLCILPCVLERQCDERVNAKGTALFYVTVKVRFDFVSSEDGSKHEVVMYGEAMDSGDKATNKAMSAAYKYAAIQAFCIPTEGDNDADSSSHEVSAKDKTLTSLPKDRQKVVQETAKAINAAFVRGDEFAVYELATSITETDEKLALWPLLPSNVRTCIKAMKEQETKAALIAA